MATNYKDSLEDMKQLNHRNYARVSELEEVANKLFPCTKTGHHFNVTTPDDAAHYTCHKEA